MTHQRLREDDDLRDVSTVWPFETGCALPPRDPGPRIVHAELYPSLVPLPADLSGRAKDCVQVEAAAHWLARHDSANALDDLFAAPGAQDVAAVTRVVNEEGWILGVRPASHQPGVNAHSETIR